MSALNIYILKSCDTCRRALKELRAAGIAPDVTDIRADGIEAARIARWLDAVGPETLINRKSTTWRGLSEADKARAETAPVELLAEHPTLLKRPVIEVGDSVFVGWTESSRAATGL